MSVARWVCLLILGFVPMPSVLAAGAVTGSADQQPLNTAAIAMFLTFVVVTLLITVWAAKRSRSASDLYVAGGGISAWQNGTAIAGDFISAASFLGITSALFAFGLDGNLLIIGVMGSWPIILFVIAERLRNLGRFTLVDVVSFRLAQRPVRLVISIASLTVILFYLIGQLVGAGKLIQLLFGLDYLYAVVTVSALMIIYVSLGGMLATTWVQLIKALLLIAGGAVTCVLVLGYFDYSLSEVFNRSVENHPRGVNLLAPGNWMAQPLGGLSLGMTMLFGFIGLPHVLMRMFTVKDAKAARQSSFVAICIMSLFYLMVIVIGFGAVSILMENPENFYDAAGNLRGGGNMVAVHVAQFVGGNLLLGFMAAVTFATILAVVAGLTLSGAATIAHDLYKTFAADRHSEKTELTIMRTSVVMIGVLGVVLGLAFENQNIAFVTSFALAVSASVNAPVLIAAMYWRGLTTRGVVISSIIGLVTSVTLIVLGPGVMVAILGYEKPWFPYTYPTIATLPVTALCIWFFSTTDRSDGANKERAAFDDQRIRSELGIGIEGASEH
ncbi:MAG: cation acetate symporter [Lysobacterales bacterium]